jgi:hypothetical protein
MSLSRRSKKSPAALDLSYLLSSYRCLKCFLHCSLSQFSIVEETLSPFVQHSRCIRRYVVDTTKLSLLIRFTADFTPGNDKDMANIS